MNKGVKIATGEVIGILNSDDFYADSAVLKKIADAFEKNDIDAAYGDLQYVKQHDVKAVTRTWKAGSFRKKNFYYGWMPPHPSFFVRRSVYDKVGLFNTALRSAADYELILRIMLKNDVNVAYIPEVLVKMRAGGMSNASFRNRLRANREDREAWRINGLKPLFFTTWLKPLRKITQFIIR
jgi:glycosyltransferase